MIVVAHRLAAEIERARGEVAIVAREAVEDGAAEQSLIARGGDLLIVRQARRVVIGRALHAERAGLRGHQFREARLVTAERFGDDHRDVVGRLGDDGADRGFDLDRFARLETQLGRRLHGGVRRHRKIGARLDLARLELLEQQVERHDLGEGGGMARAVGLVGLHHLAGVGVDDDRRGGRLIALRRCRAMAFTASAGVGVTGDCGEDEHRRQAVNAPAETTTYLGSRTQNQLSPTPFSRRSLGGLKPPN